MAVLSDTKARSLKPESPALPHGGVPGLFLEPLSKKGHGKWKLRYVSPVTGKRRTMGLGGYPAVSIADAAKHAQSCREQIAKGLDPLEEKDKEPDELMTFEKAAKILHADLLPGWKNKKHGDQWINTLTVYAFNVLGEMPIAEITPAQIAQVLKPIWIDKAETATRVKQRMHAVMAWAWAHGYVTSNPVDVVEHLLPKQEEKRTRVKHQPAMPWREIPQFIAENISGWSGFGVTRPLLAFLILTACRSGEARGATWTEIDLEEKVWTIPADRMKAKLPHRVPLSEQALSILRYQKQHARHPELVFPAPMGGLLSDMVLTSYLRRVKANSDVPGRVATAHGFRSSFRDWASENGYPRDLAERALAHTINNQTEAAYHRSDLLEQRRPMMNKWAEFCFLTL